MADPTLWRAAGVPGPNETLPAGAELETRLLGLHRERLVDSRTRLINELRWRLHDRWLD